MRLDRVDTTLPSAGRRRFLRQTALAAGAVASGAIASPAGLLASAGEAPVATPRAAPPPPFVAGTEVGGAYTLGGILLSTLARKETTGGAYGLIEGWAQPGIEPPPHVHAHEDEAVQLLDGRILFTVGGQQLEAGPGDHVFLPRRVVHTFEILSPSIHVLLLFTPGGLEAYFERYGQPAESLELPPLPSEPPSEERMRAFAALNEEFGISHPEPPAG